MLSELRKRPTLLLLKLLEMNFHENLLEPFGKVDGHKKESADFLVQFEPGTKDTEHDFLDKEHRFLDILDETHERAYLIN